MGIFKRKVREVNTSPTRFPSGSCVKTSTGHYYIRGMKKYKIMSGRALNSWRFVRIIDSTDESLKNYTLVGKVGFRDGSFVTDAASGDLYVISDGKKCRVENPDWYTILGIQPRDVILASRRELELHGEGEPFS